MLCVDAKTVSKIKTDNILQVIKYCPLSSLRVPVDERRHHCFTRSGLTWQLVANQCVHMATAATTATTTTTAATTANTTTTAATA